MTRNACSNQSDNVCIITTNKSPSILQSNSSSSSNSAIQILDPQTGSIIHTSDHHGSATTDEHGSGGSGRHSTCIKISHGVGVHSLQPIVYHRGNNNHNGMTEHLYIAYGNQYKSSQQQLQNSMRGNSDDNDMYAYLLVQGGSSSSSSSPKWKCKLPEYMSSHLITSPCGNYIIGGGKSGTCYCWSTLSCDGMENAVYNNQNELGGDSSSSGSELVSKWIAHYRSIQSIIFSDCGSYIITGGDDGIVNVWNLMDIVSSSSSYKSKMSSSSSSYSSAQINPIQTWSEHRLPITSMHALPSSRIVSTSKDNQVIIMELFNGKTLAKIDMPSSITTVTCDLMGHRLYLGSTNGAIYCIDLNTFAIANTAESASVISNIRNAEKKHNIATAAAGTATSYMSSLSGSLLEETIFGMTKHSDASSVPTGGASSSSSSLPSHITELRGHNRSISCLVLVNNDEKIVSGSIDGSIRVWDIRSRCCIHVTTPWSTNNTIIGTTKGDDEKSGKNFVFPCSSITVIPREWIDNSDDDDGASTFTSMTSNSHGGGGGRKRKRKNNHGESLADLIQPLQRYTKREQQIDDGSRKDLLQTAGFVPIFSRAVHDQGLSLIQEIESHETSPNLSRKKIRSEQHNNGVVDRPEDNPNLCHEQDDETKRELEQLREEVSRWKKVNNKLMQKLKDVVASSNN
jgi:WD40 repeat protein